MDYEKKNEYSQEPATESKHPEEERRGSAYQVIPPGERRLSLQGRRISVVDDIFGEIKEGGPNYRNVSSNFTRTIGNICFCLLIRFKVGWLGTSVLMIKTQIGLGVLSIPSVLDTLGMGPGLVVLILIGVITTWSNYMIGEFKKNHPSVYSIDDVGFKLFGRWGREFFYVAFLLCQFPLCCS